MAELDASFAIQSQGPGLWRGRADPQYEANTGMFGGWTMALLLKAVVDDPDAEGTASAITTNFLSRVPPGAELKLRTQRLGGGRSLSHWRSELMLEDETVAATAMIVLANRRESDKFIETEMPDAAAPESIAVFHPPGPFGERIDIRQVLGGVPFNQSTTRSLFWQRDLSGREIDAVQLAYLCDLGPPRVWYIGSTPRPSSTITLSLYIHAPSAELAACGDDLSCLTWSAHASNIPQLAPKPISGAGAARCSRPPSNSVGSSSWRKD
jgi:hypothetical protein